MTRPVTDPEDVVQVGDPPSTEILHAAPAPRPLDHSHAGALTQGAHPVYRLRGMTGQAASTTAVGFEVRRR